MYHMDHREIFGQEENIFLSPQGLYHLKEGVHALKFVLISLIWSVAREFVPGYVYHRLSSDHISGQSPRGL